MKDYGPIGFVAYIILLVGGINWGLYGLFKIDLIHAMLGAGFLARIIYIIVGAAAGYLIYLQYFKKKAV
jgi:uncharacterized protein